MTMRISLFALLCVLLPAAGSTQSAAQNLGQSQNVQMAALQPLLVLERTSPTQEHPDGPVLYQLLFSTGGTPGTLAKFDTNPRHLTNSLITDNGTQVAIGNLAIAGNGIITFANGQTFPGASGTVTSVGLAAPASDFSVSGSPVTGSGTLTLNWNVPPSSANIANAIVRRDGNGDFVAGGINASAILALNNAVSRVGVTGIEAATSGGGVGVYGESDSTSGTAGVFYNSAGGKILSGQANSGEVFSVGGLGVKTTGFQLTTGAVAGKVLTSDFEGNGIWLPLQGAWLLRGNVIGCNAAPCFNFLGATDNSVLEFRVNNTGAFRLVPEIDAGDNNSPAPNIIGGYTGNGVLGGAVGGTIAGGGEQGFVNTVIAGNFGTIGGGSANTVSAFFGTVSGGGTNTASSTFATVGGGTQNTASGSDSTVAGGVQNTASASFSTVGGGGGNQATNNSATVPGGNSNIAAGLSSFAAGAFAHANDDNSFLWGDGSRTANSQGPDSFTALATGGIFFFFNSANNDHCTLNSTSGWACTSDRNAKENFRSVDHSALLERLRSITVPEWHGKGEPAEIKHMGPMAQDFYAAFGLGRDNTTIGTTDAQGVAFAAIQGLYDLVKANDTKISGLRSAIEPQLDSKNSQLLAQEKELAEQRQQISTQQQQIETLEHQVKALEEKLRAMLGRVEAAEAGRDSARSERMASAGEQ
jgi:hypothetical protein